MSGPSAPPESPSGGNGDPPQSNKRFPPRNPKIFTFPVPSPRSTYGELAKSDPRPNLHISASGLSLPRLSLTISNAPKVEIYSGYYLLFLDVVYVNERSE